MTISSVATNFQTPSHATDQPKRSMRKYEVASLRSDGSLHHSDLTGPASPMFESAFNAFARGTLIKTTQGPVAVEDLKPGMKLITADRGASTLIWIGSVLLMPQRNRTSVSDNQLTRVMSDSFGGGRPMTDFIAGPGARILTRPVENRDSTGADRVLTPLRQLVDGVNVISVTPPSPVRVYHLCLPRHATVMAAGLEVETFHPGPGFERSMGVNMLRLFLSLFPHIREPRDFGSLSHPRLDV